MMSEDRSYQNGILDAADCVQKFGDYTKEQLVAALYDESGEGETKKELRQLSRGYLLARVLIELHGDCQIL